MPVLHPLSGSVEKPQQYKQPSRKGKKAWRKNVDITEIEAGLKERNEEIIKGGLISESKSADLFTIDTIGDSKIKVQLPKKERQLKADEIIAQRSVVPAVSLRKRPSDKTTDGLVATKRIRTDWVSHKELQRLRNVADGRHDTPIQINDASYDMWASPTSEQAQPEADQSYAVKPRQPVKAPGTLRQQPISLTASGKAVPPVKKPGGGHSYNPTFADYEKRLQEEGQKEVEAEQKRLAALEADRKRLEAAAKSAAEADAAEARAELSEWDEDSAWEGVESGVEDAKTSTKRPERKTKVQRNKIKRRKEEERRLKHEAAIKRKHAQLSETKRLAMEVDARERELERTGDSAESESEGDDEILRRKQLGKFRLPEKDLELVLPDELQDSLRRLKPEGNLLKDRYRSLLVRGKVESRRRIPFKKQARVKVTEKWTHKDFTLL